ncbi:MAG: hypothetical protein ACREAM_16215, partial [Blastocatellia bacterium]
YNPVTKAEFDYVQSGQDETGWKAGLKNFLAGMSAGSQGGQPGENWRSTLGRALGGGAVGAIGGKMNPTGGAEMRFNAWERPRMEQDLAQQRAGEEYATRQATAQARLEGLQSETALNQARAKKVLEPQAPKPAYQPAPRWVAVAGEKGEPVYVDLNSPENYGKTLTPYQNPAVAKTPSTSEALKKANTEEVAREGTVEEIAMKSTNERLPEVIASAGEHIRSILQTGKKPSGEPATAQEIERAQSWLNKQMNRLYQQNLRYTRGVRERNKAKRVTGQTPAATGSQPTGSGITRPRSQFNSNKFPGLRFD